MNLGKRHISLFQRVDDTLDVFHTHFVGSLVGGIGTGLFATVEGCAAFGLSNPGGAIVSSRKYKHVIRHALIHYNKDGNGRQVWVQIVSALFIIGWNVVWTSLIMLFIKYVLRVSLRMSDAACKVGDYAVHREESYTFAYYNRALLPEGSLRGPLTNDLEGGIHGIIMGRAAPDEPSHVGRPRGSEDDGVTPVKKDSSSNGNGDAEKQD